MRFQLVWSNTMPSATVGRIEFVWVWRKIQKDEFVLAVDMTASSRLSRSGKQSERDH